MSTATEVPAGLLVKEAKQPLTINGMRAVDFIRRAYDLGTDLNGPGRYDHHDPIQSELRNIKGWIEMAEHDALQSRRGEANGP
jgi:hypothetical protein